MLEGSKSPEPNHKRKTETSLNLCGILLLLLRSFERNMFFTSTSHTTDVFPTAINLNSVSNEPNICLSKRKRPDSTQFPRPSKGLYMHLHKQKSSAMLQSFTSPAMFKRWMRVEQNIAPLLKHSRKDFQFYQGSLCNFTGSCSRNCSSIIKIEIFVFIWVSSVVLLVVVGGILKELS